MNETTHPILSPFEDSDAFYEELKEKIPKLTESDLQTFIVTYDITSDRFFRVLLSRKSFSSDFYVANVDRISVDTLIRHGFISEELVDKYVCSMNSEAVRDILKAYDSGVLDYNNKIYALVRDIVEIGF